MAWDGYNFEDAIIISETLVKEDVYTSIHIEEFEIEIRETKLGREEFTRDIPNVSEKALRNLDDNGIVRIGTYVKPGDILVGKVAPKTKSELTPEEKLLHAIFGRAGEDVKNDSPGSALGRRGHRHRHPAVQPPDEPQRGRAQGLREGAEGHRGRSRTSRRSPTSTSRWSRPWRRSSAARWPTPTRGKPLGREKDPKDLAEESERFKLEKLDLRSPEASKKAREGRPPVRPADRGPHGREGPQAQQPEARRRAALGRARRWSRSTSPPSG